MVYVIDNDRHDKGFVLASCEPMLLPPAKARAASLSVTHGINDPYCGRLKRRKGYYRRRASKVMEGFVDGLAIAAPVMAVLAAIGLGVAMLWAIVAIGSEWML